MIEVRPTDLDGVVEITPTRHGDDRGWFSEIWNRSAWSGAGLPDIHWVQDNESLSAPKATLRGIHFQRNPHAQDKLVRVISGRIIDVAVDLRRSSSTFGNHVAVTLDSARGNQLFVPRGFGHGFVTLDPDCRVAYKVSAVYNAESDAGIDPFDQALAIDWGVSPQDAKLSAKDLTAPRLGDADDLLFD